MKAIRDACGLLLRSIVVTSEDRTPKESQDCAETCQEESQHIPDIGKIIVVRHWGSPPLCPRRLANGVALGDLPGVEQVELDFPHDVGDAGLAWFPGGEVTGFF